MLNGLGYGQRDEDAGAWEGLQDWLSGLAAAETEVEVLCCLQEMLAASGLPHGLYLENRHEHRHFEHGVSGGGASGERASGSESSGEEPGSVFRPARAWRLSSPVSSPLSSPLTSRPPTNGRPAADVPAPGLPAPERQVARLPVPVAVPPIPSAVLAAGQARALDPAEKQALTGPLGAPANGGTGLLLPLRAGRRHLGTVVAFCDVRGARPGALEMLALLAPQAALAFERAHLHARLPLLERRIQAVDRASIGLFQADQSGRVVWYNARFQEITALQPEFGHDLWAYLVPGHEQQRFNAWWQDGLLGREAPPHQFALLVPGGGTRWVEASSTPLFTPDGQMSGQVGTLEDVTGRRAVQERLTFQAWHDPLTKLPNRTFLQQVWPQLAESAERTGTALALLFIDLERFKQVNDSLGHAVGDQLLTLMARRLQTAVGSGGVVTRHGGDEFVVLLRDIESAQQAREKAEALLPALRLPLRIDHHLLQVSCRMGLSLYPKDAADLPTLLQHADAAMYKLKHTRQGGVLAYACGMSSGGLEQLDLESEFRTGLERGELRLHFQPQYELAGGQQVGWEALVRWQHPRHGLLYPGAFLPMVADAGLLTPLGDWVIAETHRQLTRWAAQGKPLWRVAVNVDARQLAPGHLSAVIGQLRETQPLLPGLLELEITEEALPSDVQAIDRDLKELQAAGITVAIDDFGRGFSNLGQLQRLHFDRLKIDRSYVTYLESSASDRAIVQAAISIGHALGARVLAEGVETAGQLEVLRALGCDEGQGFLWAKPRPAAELSWP